MLFHAIDWMLARYEDGVGKTGSDFDATSVMAKYLAALFLVCTVGLCRASANEVWSAEDRSYFELRVENEA